MKNDDQQRISVAEVEKAFRDRVRMIPCPSCNVPFTHAAIAWGLAWREGYVYAFREQGRDIRDGPFWLKCSPCNARSSYDVFANRATLAKT